MAEGAAGQRIDARRARPAADAARTRRCAAWGASSSRPRHGGIARRDGFPCCIHRQTRPAVRLRGPVRRFATRKLSRASGVTPTALRSSAHLVSGPADVLPFTLLVGGLGDRLDATAPPERPGCRSGERSPSAGRPLSRRASDKLGDADRVFTDRRKREGDVFAFDRKAQRKSLEHELVPKPKLGDFGLKLTISRQGEADGFGHLRLGQPRPRSDRLQLLGAHVVPIFNDLRGRVTGKRTRINGVGARIRRI